MKLDYPILLLKRTITYFTTKIIIFIPISIILFFFAEYSCEFYSGGINSGFISIACTLRSLFLPAVGYYFYDAIDKVFFYARVYTTGLITISFIAIDFLASILFLNRLYKKKLNIQFKRIRGYGEVSTWRIIVRTIIKYITIIFACPLLLFPIFNKRRFFLHEIISGVCKVSTVPPKEKEEETIDTGIVFKEDFSSYDEQ